MAGISSKALSFGAPENKYKFGGKELQSNEFSDNSGLELYDFHARMYDQQIGRFPNVDPLASGFTSWSPYAYSYNNPIRFGDPTGMSGTDWVKKNNTWTYNEEIKTAEQAKAAGYDDFRENGSTIENARIGKDGRVGAVYLGYSANDVAYSENNFTNWNAVHGSEYDTQVDAYRAWQSYSGYHKGEGFWDRTFRVMAYGSMEARRDYASGGMNMYGGYGKVAQAAESVWRLGPGPRGLAIEAQLGGNLPASFPTVDKFANGVATSIKSVDLAAPTYQNVATLASKVDGYINKVAGFNGASWGGVTIQAGQIQARGLTIAVQSGVGSAEQMATLQQAVQTAASRGVRVTIITIK